MYFTEPEQLHLIPSKLAADSGTFFYQIYTAWIESRSENKIFLD